MSEFGTESRQDREDCLKQCLDVKNIKKTKDESAK
jgi:hypothetical protein